jgi:hypothetical protein
MFDAIVARAMEALRAWFRRRRRRVRELPPLIVIPGFVAGAESTTNAGVRPSPTTTPPESGVMVDAVAPPSAASADTIRFLRPGDDSVEILPGRLEVLAGDPTHREIKFVRARGQPAELILGRDPARSPQTVELQSDTVSRRHARFEYSHGRWTVTNLSGTNPVVVNDERILDPSFERPLADGDRVELGEVVLRFRSR